MKRLPPGARAVFVLHDVEGYRHEEIGRLLGVSIGTSKSQLHRARMTLRTASERTAESHVSTSTGLSGCRSITTAS